MIDLAIDGVSAAATRIFTAAGVPGDMAAQLTAWLVNSNLSGHPSHGLQRVTEYVRQIEEGHMDPAARPCVHVETDTTVVLDGQQGIGHFAADRLTRELAARCRQSQIAMGGIVNGRHIGRLGEWGELAADLGVLLYISLGSASGEMTATYGAAEGRLGTNPIAFGAPGLEGDSFVMDFATSAAAEGKVRVARDSGKSVPAGWIRDSEGRATTDPNDFYDGGVMLTFGEHKGSAIAVMTTLLSVVIASSAEDIADGASGLRLRHRPQRLRPRRRDAGAHPAATRPRALRRAGPGLQRRAGSRRLRTPLPRRPGRRAAANPRTHLARLPPGRRPRGCPATRNRGAGPGVSGPPDRRRSVRLEHAHGGRFGAPKRASRAQ